MTDAPVAEPREQVLGSGAGGPLTAPSPWTSLKDATSAFILYPNGVVIGNPSGGNKGVGTLNLPTLYINGALVNLANYLLLAGGSMTGQLLLNADPVPADGPTTAATKNYVDTLRNNMNTSLTGYLQKSGGTMTGPLLQAADPVNPLGTATKQYVDALFSTAGLTVPDAPADGTNYGRNNNAWTGTTDLGTF